MTWPLTIALLGTSAILGRLLDAGLHRLYTPKLQDWVYRRAIWADELTYTELLHGDTKRAARVLDRVFGARWFSPQMALISLVPLFFVQLSLLAATDDPAPNNRLFVLSSELALAGVVMALTNVIQDQLSLRITRGILRRTSPSFRSLAFWISVDVGLTLFLSSLPFALFFTLAISGASLGGHYLQTLGGIAELFFMMIGAVPALTIFALIQGGISGEGGFRLAEISLFLAVFGGAIPTLVHLSMLLRDLAVKSLIRPACVYLSGLLETLAGHERPLTTVFTAVGTVPVIIKLWLDASK